MTKKAKTPKPPKDWKSEASMMAARLSRYLPNIPCGACARLAEEWERIERTASLHAVRLCNAEPTAPGDIPGFGRYAKAPVRPSQRFPGLEWEYDQEAEARSERRLRSLCDRWAFWVAEWSGEPIQVHTGGDPRGCVASVQLPGESGA